MLELADLLEQVWGVVISGHVVQRLLVLAGCLLDGRLGQVL